MSNNQNNINILIELEKKTYINIFNKSKLRNFIKIINACNKMKKKKVLDLSNELKNLSSNMINIDKLNILHENLLYEIGNLNKIINIIDNMTQDNFFNENFIEMYSNC